MQELIFSHNMHCVAAISVLSYSACNSQICMIRCVLHKTPAAPHQGPTRRGSNLWLFCSLVAIQVYSRCLTAALVHQLLQCWCTVNCHTLQAPPPVCMVYNHCCCICTIALHVAVHRSSPTSNSNSSNSLQPSATPSYHMKKLCGCSTCQTATHCC